LTERIPLLDLIRGLAAVAVFSGHLRAALFLDYAQLERTSLAIKLFYALTSFGHQAVVVFFVMSGYLVGGAVIKCRNEFAWSKYIVARLSRLWAVLIPAIFLLH